MTDQAESRTDEVEAALYVVKRTTATLRLLGSGLFAEDEKDGGEAISGLSDDLRAAYRTLQADFNARLKERSRGDDPAVAAYSVWRALWRIAEDALANGREAEAKAEWQARVALSRARATTVEGLRCQMVFFMFLSQTQNAGADVEDVDGYVWGAWADDLDRETMRNMLASAAEVA